MPWLSWMLPTSVINGLSAAMCDAVIGGIKVTPIYLWSKIRNGRPLHDSSQLLELCQKLLCIAREIKTSHTSGMNYC